MPLLSAGILLPYGVFTCAGWALQRCPSRQGSRDNPRPHPWPLSRPKVENHRQDAARLLSGGGNAQLVEDARHVLLSGAQGDHQPVGDPLIGCARCHQLEHFAFPRRQPSQRIVGSIAEPPWATRRTASTKSATSLIRSFSR